MIHSEINKLEHSFTKNNCFIKLIISGKNKKIYIDEFIRSNNIKGDGRNILAEVLRWVKKTYPGITKINLFSLPARNKHPLMLLATAQKKLNNYYISLGFFKKNNLNFFSGIIDEILLRIQHYNSSSLLLPLL